MRYFTLALIASMLFSSATAQALSLTEAVRIALENNPSLKQSQKAVESAEEEIKIAKGQRGFTVGVSASADADKTEGSSDSESASARLTGSIPLYSGGQLKANINAAEYNLDASKLDLDQAADDLTYQVATAYVNAFEQKSTWSVNLDTFANLKEHEQLISDLYTAGAKAKIDLLRAQVEASNANQDAIRAQAAYEVALTDLSVLMSLDSAAVLDDTELSIIESALTEESNTNPVSGDSLVKAYSLDGETFDIENYISLAEQNRADLKADNVRIQRAEELVKSAKAAYKPSVSASASTGLNARSDRWDPTSNATAGVSANWNIFDSKITKSRVEEAKLEVERLELALQSDLDSARSDVITACKNLKTALVRLQTTDFAVKLAEEERFIATERYRAGEGILLDILDAEVALKEARLNHLNAYCDAARYRFALNHAIGSTLPQQTISNKKAAASD